MDSLITPEGVRMRRGWPKGRDSVPCGSCWRGPGNTRIYDAQRTIEMLDSRSLKGRVRESNRTIEQILEAREGITHQSLDAMKKEKRRNFGRGNVSTLFNAYRKRPLLQTALAVGGGGRGKVGPRRFRM